MKKRKIEPHHQNQQSSYAKTKAQISCAVTAQLISAIVFAARIVQSLVFINPKVEASSILLSLYTPVCVGPSRISKLFDFL